MIKKGFRKVFVCMVAFIWALIVLIIIWLLLKDDPEYIVPALVAVLGFGSTIVLYLFASNYGEHKVENQNRVGGGIE